MRKFLAALAAALALAPQALASGDARLRAFAGPCLAALVDRENPAWEPTRYNRGGSGAYGLPQALPGSKMASAGRDWRTNPWTQLRWMRSYAVGRYGGECAALAFQVAHGWY